MSAEQVIQIVADWAKGNLSVAQECYMAAWLYRNELVADLPYPTVRIECTYLLGMGVVAHGEYLEGARVDGARCAEIGGRFSA